MNISLTEVQERAWQNKVRQGFSLTDAPLEFCLLQGEMAEAFGAWREGGQVADELADVQIYLAGLSRMLGVDLGAATAAKLAVNETRVYRTLPNGTKVKGPVTKAGQLWTAGHTPARG